MKQQLSLKTDQRLALLGRLRMASWIEMREPEFARQVEELEKDPLFERLLRGSKEQPGAVRRQRWPAGRLSGALYELDERRQGKGEPVHVEKLVGEKADLLPMIRKLGRADFERWFVHGEEALPLEEIARRSGLELEDVRRMNDLLLELGAKAEFWAPGPGAAPGYACLAKLRFEGDEPSFEFFAPYWARGRYQINYERVERLKEGLEAGERRRLRHLLSRMETLNLRQNTLYRILESLAALHAEYFRTRREPSKTPVSLRMLARKLDLAPSTISRAVAGRSLKLPWDEEVPLISLLPGRRRVLREILGGWFEAGADRLTDAQLAERLRVERRIKVSRRTVNAVRHELLKKD